MEQQSAQQQWMKLGVCLLVGVVIALLAPESAPKQGWNVFAAFMATVAGLLLRPLAMGPVVILSIVVQAAIGSLSLKEGLAGYGDTTVWLVVAAFLIAGGVVESGFGRRIALSLVVRWGKRTQGIARAICAAEFLLGPVVPSNTARGGGILAPIVRSLAEALDSFPEKQPRRAGAYLALVGAHANLIAAAAFLTGMAANPLVSKAAADIFGVEFTWGMWALGALPPALLGMFLLPSFVAKLHPPELVEAGPARERARQDLKAMGPWSKAEKWMATIFVVLITLWVSKAFHGMGTTVVAWIGVCLLFLSGTQTWDDMTHNFRAWDTLIWLGGLLAMANALRNHGFVEWFATTMSGYVDGLAPLLVVIVLVLIYFYSMYAFSMLTAHISAFVGAFFALALAADVPPLLMIAMMAYFGNLCACTTNYSSGPIVIYYGLGYVPSHHWFSVGFAMSLFHLVIWLGVGLPWLKFLGWW